jgi:hypothetical protein
MLDQKHSGPRTLHAMKVGRRHCSPVDPMVLQHGYTYLETTTSLLLQHPLESWQAFSHQHLQGLQMIAAQSNCRC